MGFGATNRASGDGANRLGWERGHLSGASGSPRLSYHATRRRRMSGPDLGEQRRKDAKERAEAGGGSEERAGAVASGHERLRQGQLRLKPWVYEGFCRGHSGRGLCAAARCTIADAILGE